MARYLAVGNCYDRDWCDLRIFFSNAETEFLNTGPDKGLFGLQKRPDRAILADVRHQQYDLVIAGDTGFPHFNPRKGLLRNFCDTTWKTLRHPNLIAGRRFPFSRLSVPLAGLDLSDSMVVDNRRFRVLERCVCFFKRELPQNPSNTFLYTTAKTENSCNVTNIEFFRNAIEKLRPISLGIDSAIAARISEIHPEKRVDVFYAGRLENRMNRQAGLKQLQQLKAEGYAVDVASERLPQDEFFRRCAQAYLVWSPEGNGWDCWRHYEAALAGSVPLMQTPTIRRHAPLRDEVHAIYYFIEEDHLAVRVRQALQNRPRLVEMGRAARQHVLTWHTHAALSRYVIEETQRTRAEAGLLN
jgi:hypothetical protein